MLTNMYLWTWNKTTPNNKNNKVSTGPVGDLLCFELLGGWLACWLLAGVLRCSSTSSSQFGFRNVGFCVASKSDFLCFGMILMILGVTLRAPMVRFFDLLKFAVLWASRRALDLWGAPLTSSGELVCHLSRWSSYCFIVYTYIVYIVYIYCLYCLYWLYILFIMFILFKLLFVLFIHLNRASANTQILVSV